MTITTADVDSFLLDNYASGPITSFGNDTVGVCYFNYTYTYSSGSMSGQTVTTIPHTTGVPSAKSYSGISVTPGGEIHSPWSLAGNRAPTSFPLWTQTIIYKGTVRAVQIELRKLLALVGVTASLDFAQGRMKLDGSVTGKSCYAMLMPINGTMERVLTTPSFSTRTWLEVTASWQQTGKFYN